MRAQTVRAIGLAVLLVLAGCGSSGAGGSNTVNPALEDTPSPSPTATATPTFPQGLSASGIDAGEVADAHREAFQNAAYHYRRIVRSQHGNVMLRQDREGMVNGRRLLSRSVAKWDARGVARPPGPNGSLWANGTTFIQRTEARDGDAQFRVGNGAPPIGWNSSATGATLVYTLLLPWDPSFVETRRTANVTLYIYRQTADRIERAGQPTARDVIVRVVVGSDGLVYRVGVRYTTERSGTTVRVSERYWLTAVGNVTVPRPEWVGQAVNESTRR